MYSRVYNREESWSWRGVAYLGADGELVKTAAWDEMAHKMTMPLPHEGSYLRMSLEDKLENQQCLEPEQLVKIKKKSTSAKKKKRGVFGKTHVSI